MCGSWKEGATLAFFSNEPLHIICLPCQVLYTPLVEGLDGVTITAQSDFVRPGVFQQRGIACLCLSMPVHRSEVFLCGSVLMRTVL